MAPDARHPFGTGNCCVFFKNRTYLEPITILDRNRADMAAAEGIVFVKRLKRFTERQGEGFAMVALEEQGRRSRSCGVREGRAVGGSRPFASAAGDASGRQRARDRLRRSPSPIFRRRRTRHSSPASILRRTCSSSRPISSIRTGRSGSSRSSPWRRNRRTFRCCSRVATGQRS